MLRRRASRPNGTHFSDLGFSAILFNSLDLVSYSLPGIRVRPLIRRNLLIRVGELKTGHGVPGVAAC